MEGAGGGVAARVGWTEWLRCRGVGVLSAARLTGRRLELGAILRTIGRRGGCVLVALLCLGPGVAGGADGPAALPEGDVGVASKHRGDGQPPGAPPWPSRTAAFPRTGWRAAGRRGA